MRQEIIHERALDGVVKALEAGLITANTKEQEVRWRFRCRKVDEHRKQMRTRDQEVADSTECVGDAHDDASLVREMTAAAVQAWLQHEQFEELVKNKLKERSKSKNGK